MNLMSDTGMGQMRMPNGTMGNMNAAKFTGENKRNIAMLMRLRKQNKNQVSTEMEEAGPEVIHKLMSEFKMMTNTLR